MILSIPYTVNLDNILKDLSYVDGLISFVYCIDFETSFTLYQFLHKFNPYKLQHYKGINELWQKNEYLRDKMGDPEHRSRRDNLRVDALKEIENETWEQTEEILQQMIRDVLELEGINTERAHAFGNKSNGRTSPKSIVTKFSSYKDNKTKTRGTTINKDSY